MTIESIALKHVPCRCGEAYTSRGLEAPDCPYHSTDPQEAMKEWAKQQAIAFDKWKNKQRYIADSNSDDMYWDNDGEQYSTGMLYDLFLQSQKQNQ